MDGAGKPCGCGGGGNSPDTSHEKAVGGPPPGIVGPIAKGNVIQVFVEPNAWAHLPMSLNGFPREFREARPRTPQRIAGKARPMRIPPENLGLGGLR
jgi:hypothetical protein